jgi:hypothetical protein
MSNDDDLSNFDKEINDLVDQIRTIFNTDVSRWFLHEQTDTLYVEIKGIESYPESEVEALLTPIMDELELDFEEIILLPYAES